MRERLQMEVVAIRVPGVTPAIGLELDFVAEILEVRDGLRQGVFGYGRRRRRFGWRR